jgi:hypothetical protein
MAVQVVLGIIGTIALLILLIRTHMRRPLKSIFVLLFLMCILVLGLAACGEPVEPSPAQFPPSGVPLPTPTISGPNPLQTGTPCLAHVITGQNCGK